MFAVSTAATFFTALFAPLYLFHFALYDILLRISVNIGNFFLEILKFTAYLARFLAFRLNFTYGANGIFYLGIRSIEKLACIFLCLGNDFLAAGLEFLHFALVTVNYLFETLFLLMNSLTFRFPIAFVAHNVKQIFVAVNVVFSHNL